MRALSPKPPPIGASSGAILDSQEGAFAIRITHPRNKPCATNHISLFVDADSDLRAAP
jgi:hypothetical protein